MGGRNLKPEKGADLLYAGKKLYTTFVSVTTVQNILRNPIQNPSPNPISSLKPDKSKIQEKRRSNSYREIETVLKSLKPNVQDPKKSESTNLMNQTRSSSLKPKWN